jgi:hypothetical protein
VYKHLSNIKTIKSYATHRTFVFLFFYLTLEVASNPLNQSSPNHMRYLGHNIMRSHVVYTCRTMYTLNFRISTPLMSLLLLYPKTLGNKCSHYKSHSLLSHFPPYITGFDTKINHQKSQTTNSHASHYHYHDNVDLALFHNITCHTHSLVSNTHPC